MKLFELFATLALNTQDFVKGVNNAGKQAKGFANTVQTRFTAASVAIGNLTARGIAKVADAGVKMVKDSLNVVKEFEQNLGGSEAVFGEWAKTVQDTGRKAYKNMGLSLSDYLATANKMGSLFKGAGYTTGEAMDMTTKAMQRAADVASIMGVDAEWAMESIAGLAKGNFTMMDNLGVAINDTALANYALEKGIKKSVSAMSTQEKIGLALELFMERTAEYAGNYAKENTTLAGSYEVLGAAYENMLIGQEGATEDFVDALGVAAKATMKNLGEIAPRLGQSMWQGIQRAAPRVKAAFVNLWDNELPGLATRAANGLIGTINNVFGTNIPTVEKIDFPTWEEVETTVSDLAGKVKGVFQNIGNVTLKILGVDSADEAIKKIKGAWDDVVYAVTNADQIVDDFMGFDVSEAWSGAMQAIKDWWDANIAGAIQTAINKLDEFFGYPSKKTFDVQFNYHVNATEQAYEDINKGATDLWGSETAGDLAETYVRSTSVNPDSNYDFASALNFLFGDGERVGLDYVPYDNYLSRLHEGEAVLTKAEAEQWRRGASNVAERIDYGKMGEAVAVALAGMAVQMDGVTVGHMVSPTVSRDIAQNAKSRRYSR